MQENTAVIERKHRVDEDGATVNYDLERHFRKPRDGSFWLASEGNAKGRPNLLIHAAASGEVLEEVSWVTGSGCIEKQWF